MARQTAEADSGRHCPARQRRPPLILCSLRADRVRPATRYQSSSVTGRQLGRASRVEPRPLPTHDAARRSL